MSTVKSKAFFPSRDASICCSLADAFSMISRSRNCLTKLPDSVSPSLVHNASIATIREHVQPQRADAWTNRCMFTAVEHATTPDHLADIRPITFKSMVTTWRRVIFYHSMWQGHNQIDILNRTPRFHQCVRRPSPAFDDKVSSIRAY